MLLATVLIPKSARISAAHATPEASSKLKTPSFVDKTLRMILPGIDDAFKTASYLTSS